VPEAERVAVLTRAEAVERARLLRVDAYEVDLDLTADGDTFPSRTTIRFRCLAPGAATFVEHTVPRIRSITFNGRGLDPASVDDGRIALADLAAENVLVVESDAPYSADREGVTRIVDPDDGETYLYSQCFLDFAQRVFACFDQPDLKAPFSLSVAAPEGWTVLSNGAGRRTAPGRWSFEPTPQISTYLVSVAAGPYHSVESEHDGIALGLYCRRSLAAFLEPDDILDDTRRAFDFYQRLFDRRYAFGKYDQLFVPEFGGAMEHPGCVTYTDNLLFRSPVTDEARRSRTNFITHEMAHMWFGDLVTMRWWDDLWLNEAFAELLAYLAMSEATRHRTAWTSAAIDRMTDGYRADQLPSTHPIVGDVPDTAAAFLNFDSISYVKGGAALRQLAAWIGRDAFEAGLRRYIADHAFGNTSLADLLAAFEAASDRDVSGWATRWLETAGVSTLSPAPAGLAGGLYRSIAVAQTVPADHPTLRPHRVGIGLYDRRDGALVRRDLLEVDVDGASTDVPELAGADVPDLLLLNDGDLTWAKVGLDDRSLATLLDGGIGTIEDPLTRVVAWSALYHLTRDGSLAAGRFVSTALDGLADETDIGIFELLLGRIRDVAVTLGDPAFQAGRLGALSERASRLMAGAAGGSDRQLAAARAVIAGAVSEGDGARLAEWLAGRSVPDGLVVGPDLRWDIVRRLAALGRLDDAGIDAELERDRTTAGEAAAGVARASRPTEAAKASAWSTVIGSDVTPLFLRRSAARGFWQPEQIELGRPYVGRYVEDGIRLWREGSTQSALVLSANLFPRYHADAASLAIIDAGLARADLDPGFRRTLAEGRSDLERAVRTRALDRESGG
jgi:aminopeptidase N